ncbi:hypothetical protein HED54_15540 [Ochrobactrum anthropi ATCC 49188]|nr:hypothetical protein [Brucella anthropi ATCC 49188]
MRFGGENNSGGARRQLNHFDFRRFGRKNALTESRLIASLFLILIIKLKFKPQCGKGQVWLLPCGVLALNF